MPSPLVATGELVAVRLRLHEQRRSGDEFHEILGRPGTDPALRELRRALEVEVAAIAGRTLGSDELRARVRWQSGSLDVSAVLVVDELEIEATALLAGLREIAEHVAVAIRDRISAWLDRPLWAEPERIEMGGGLLTARAAPAPPPAKAADAPAGDTAPESTPLELVAYAALALVVLVVVAATVLVGAQWVT